MPRTFALPGGIGSVFNAQAAVPSAKDFFAGTLGKIVGETIGESRRPVDPRVEAQAALYRAQAEAARGAEVRSQGTYDRRVGGQTSMGEALAEAAAVAQGLGLPRGAATLPANGAAPPPMTLPGQNGPAPQPVPLPVRPATVAPDGASEVDGVTITAPRATPVPDQQTIMRELMPSILKIGKAFATGDFTPDELKNAQTGMGMIFGMMPQLDDYIARSNAVQGKYLGDNENVSVSGQTAQREDRQTQERSINDADNETSRANNRDTNATSRANSQTSAGATIAAARINQDGAMDRTVYESKNRPVEVDYKAINTMLPEIKDEALAVEVKRRAAELVAAGATPATAAEQAFNELAEQKRGWFGSSKTVRRAAPAPAAPAAMSDDDIKRQLGL